MLSKRKPITSLSTKVARTMAALSCAESEEPGVRKISTRLRGGERDLGTRSSVSPVTSEGRRMWGGAKLLHYHLRSGKEDLFRGKKGGQPWKRRN